MAHSELEQALLDRLRVNDTERLAVLADQLGSSADEVLAAAESLRAEGVHTRHDESGRDLLVVYARRGGPQTASPGDDQPPA